MEAFKAVSMKLGNTVAVCKKYYVHPGIVNLYEKNSLSRFLQNAKSVKETPAGLSSDEKQLMKILYSIHHTKTKTPEQLLRASIKRETKQVRKRRKNRLPLH